MGRVTLGGQEHTLTATGGAMRQIEQLSELTLAELFQAHVAHRLKLEEMAAILHAGMAATQGSDAVNFGAVLDRVFELRMTDEGLRRSVGEYLIELLYHPDDAGKRTAAMTLLEHGGSGGAPAT